VGRKPDSTWGGGQLLGFWSYAKGISKEGSRVRIGFIPLKKKEGEGRVVQQGGEGQHKGYKLVACCWGGRLGGMKKEATNMYTYPLNAPESTASSQKRQRGFLFPEVKHRKKSHRGEAQKKPRGKQGED